jgi:fructokinase
MSEHPRIVVAGEALIDLAAAPTPGSYRAHPGGGPANAAVALARLGADVGFVGRLSTDPFGEALVRWFTDNGVDLSLTVRTDLPTTLAVASPDHAGVMSYTFYSQGTSNWQWEQQELLTELPGVQALHLGSLASRVEPAATVIDNLRRRCAPHLTVFADPNFRGQFDDPQTARTQLSTWVTECDIVKLSVDDVAFAHAGDDPMTLARRWSTRADVLILLTDGPRGAHAFADGVTISAATRPAQVIDTIGAGDAFGAAFLFTLQALGGLAKGSSRPPEMLERALQVACTCATITCERAGADTPKLADLPSDIVELLRS